MSLISWDAVYICQIRFNGSVRKNVSDLMGYCVFARLDLLSLDERREQLCLSFALKCTKHPKFKNMFPLNQKAHNMETRFTEKYKVQHAHTERLKTSSIIYMQHLLNEHEVQNSGQT